MMINATLDRFESVLNEPKECLVQHHVKYLELHGEDKIVMMTRSEHRKLHHKLRKEGKCKVPAEELGKISFAAHKRTEKAKLTQAVYAKTEKYKLAQSKCQKKYIKNINVIDFYDKVDNRIYLRESIRFNSNTGSVYVVVYFHHPGKEIVFIDI